MPIYKVVAFGCLHAPITHSGFFDTLIKTIEEVQPDYIYNLGDWYEGLAASRHVRDPRHKWKLMDEHRAVHAQAERINQAAPNAKKYWLYGNHDDNLFGIHADRLPEDLREVAQWRNNVGVCKELKEWRVRETYKHGDRCYLGQLSFGHGVALTDAAPRDEAYAYAVHHGLDVRAHTHRPEAVTQCRERKGVLPFYHCNVGTGADWDKMFYMDRQSKLLWGRGILVAQVSCRGEGKEHHGERKWDAELRVHSFANEKRTNLRIG